MPDYKKMYHKMMGETERAIRILIQAQRDCEELYLAESEDQDFREANPGEMTAEVPEEQIFLQNTVDKPAKCDII